MSSFCIAEKFIAIYLTLHIQNQKKQIKLGFDPGRIMGTFCEQEKLSGDKVLLCFMGICAFHRKHVRFVPPFKTPQDLVDGV